MTAKELIEFPQTLSKDTLITLSVDILYDENGDEITRPITFTISELAGLVGCAIELVYKAKQGHDVENTLRALEETFQMLDNVDCVLVPPPDSAQDPTSRK